MDFHWTFLSNLLPVLGSLGGSNGIPLTRGLEQSFLPVLGLIAPRSRCFQIPLLVRVRFLAYGWLSSRCVLTQQHCSIHEGTPSWPNRLPKAPHTLPWGLGL